MDRKDNLIFPGKEASKSGASILDGKKRRELGLYLHIPFCVRKCDYCDFLSAPALEKVKKEYIDALIVEINSYQGCSDDYIVPTIFIGGGTPSCLEAEEISRVFLAVRNTFSIEEESLEATIEVNPGTVNEKKLLEYRKAGINRLSFGLQSTKEEELKKLGRIHTYQEFEANYRLAREVGFRNINVDLMSALPGQTISSWEATLHTIADLRPKHISAYSLIIEEGTRFYEKYGEGTPGASELPDEDTDREMYYRTKEILGSYGYERYEISNYAKKKYESRHNNSYWIGTEYLGLGLGAASYLDGVRFNNINELQRYLFLCTKQDKDWQLLRRTDMHQDSLGIRTALERLTKEQKMEEFLFLGLRRCEGIEKSDFLNRFLIEIEEVYGAVIKKLEQQQLLYVDGDILRLTDYGIDISNSVLAEFLLN